MSEDLTTKPMLEAILEGQRHIVAQPQPQSSTGPSSNPGQRHDAFDSPDSSSATEARRKAQLALSSLNPMKPSEAVGKAQPTMLPFELIPQANVFGPAESNVVKSPSLSRNP